MSLDRIEMLSDADHLSFTFQMNATDLNFLALQTAASLIVACQTYPKGINDIPEQCPIGYQLTRKTNWASHGYTNALLTQAQFIYAIIENSVKTNKLPFCTGGSSMEILTLAMEEFQHYKTEQCKTSQKEFGENFGSRSEFFTFDWTKNNKAFLDIWSKMIEKDKLARKEHTSSGYDV